MSDRALRKENTLAPGVRPATVIDTSTAHIARVYDYFLGGKDNFPADRQAAARILKGNPGMRATCRAYLEGLAST